MFCLQLEDELPLAGFLSLCSSEVAVDELWKFLVEGGTRFEIAQLVWQATIFLFGRNLFSSRLVEWGKMGEMHKGIDCPKSVVGHLSPDWKDWVSKQNTGVVGETALMETNLL